MAFISMILTNTFYAQDQNVELKKDEVLIEYYFDLDLDKIFNVELKAIYDYGMGAFEPENREGDVGFIYPSQDKLAIKWYPTKEELNLIGKKPVFFELTITPEEYLSSKYYIYNKTKITTKPIKNLVDKLKNPDKHKKSNNTESKVTYHENPEIVVNSPAMQNNKVSTNENRIEISGIIKNSKSFPATIKLNNNQSLTLQNDSSFAFLFSLKPGDNLISLVYSDANSDTVSENFTVHRIVDEDSPIITFLKPSQSTFSTDERLINFAGEVKDNSKINKFVIGGNNITLGANNSFNFNLTLDNGNNEIIVLAEDVYGNKSSKKFDVYREFDNSVPVITITKPDLSGRIALKSKRISIAGFVEEESEISKFTMNGQAVSLSANKRFRETVSLSNGKNTFKFIAEDASGNRGTRTFSLSYYSSNYSPPQIEILSPNINANNMYETSDESITIMGNLINASEVEKVMVNDKEGVLFTDGKFTAKVKLKDGNNFLNIEAVKESKIIADKLLQITKN